jgi:SulP family sulfate permease
MSRLKLNQFKYERLFAHWRDDLIAGITVAVVALPLALAFAVASGVEPKAGLYTAIVAGIVASLFGGCPVQITGPTGAMAVVLVGIVSQHGIEKIWIAGVMAGIIQVALGFFKLGKLVKFIPYPVTVGFTNGIAVIIFCGQLNNFLGLKLPRSEHFLPGFGLTLSNLGQINLVAVFLGLVVIFTQIFWPRINQKVPGSLVGLVLATIIASILQLKVPTIGVIPQSLPLPQGISGWNDFGLIRELINPAIAIAALGAIESLLSAVVADAMSVSEKHDSDRELIGQGLANIVVPFFGGIPATGAIARTAVNVRSGGKTALSGISHGVVLALIVLLLAPLAAKIPMAALAGILMVTSFRMIEWEAVEMLVQHAKGFGAKSRRWGRATLYSDFAVMLLTWLITVIFDLILAVEVGLIAAGILFIRHMSELNLVKLSEANVFPPGVPLEVGKHIAVYRLDGALFFGAAEQFVRFLREVPQVKYLILRMRFVPTIDSTGVIALEEIYHDLQRRDRRLILSGLQPEVLDMLKRTKFIEKIGSENCFETTDQAIHAVLPSLEADLK